LDKELPGFSLLLEARLVLPVELRRRLMRHLSRAKPRLTLARISHQFFANVA